MKTKDLKNINPLFTQYCSIFKNDKNTDFNIELNKQALYLELLETKKKDNVQFHSRYGILQDEFLNPTLKKLKQLFYNKAQEHIDKIAKIPFLTMDDNCEDPKAKESKLIDIKSWCLVQRKNAYAAMHTHYNINLTCIYYSKVLKDAPNPQGYLEVMDPNLFVSFGRHKQESVFIQPEEGMLVILPGYIPHCTHPIFIEGQERISWVCDFRIEEQF